ncbi:TylF/MycF/NovP-related O-methyltransferase [Hymenobacter bucti]|uniref:TylF/MycF/NovP-related O-methyltransferase n=1 Tax=Hymenobacter bucti TaxID=1844114 RepID=A0ABW4QUX4_9BACT
MNNFFISEPPFAAPARRLVTLLNKGLHFLKPGYQLTAAPNPVVDMNTLEQRINYFHLLDATLAAQIPGDVIELGCFTGQCALLFQKVLQMHHSDKMLHLYDSFETQFTLQGNVANVLERNFALAGLPMPVLHKGYFQQTLPSQLPARICFTHIDCGFGADALAHKEVMLHCLQTVYPRLSKGAVCVLMDYHDRRSGAIGHDVNPGVKLACDEFLASKPEQLVALYGNQISHAFFRKVAD